MKPKSISIDLIRLDGDTQSRLAINETVVDDYSELIDSGADGWNMPPVDVFYDGSVYWLGDGFHRVLAAERKKRGSIPCNVHKGTAIDAKIFAMTANDRHGLRMTRSDKRACVEWLLDNGGKMTQREIAEKAGVTRRHVVQIVSDRKPEKVNHSHHDGGGSEPRPTEQCEQQTAPNATNTGANDEQAEQTTEQYEDVPDEPESTGSIVLDAIGRDVPQDKRAAIELAPAIQSEARKLDAILRKLLELADEDGGQFLSVSSLETAFKALKGEVFGSCYWSECPKCEGAGGKCRDCDNHGWWPNRKKGHVSGSDKQWLGVE